MNCSICSKYIEEPGHNAQPINDGRCCNDCNALVIYERMKGIPNDTNNT